MITQDAVSNLILAMNRYMVKRGDDIEARKNLTNAFNIVFGEDLLDGIYLNTLDNVMIPDISVIHNYNDKFTKYLLDPDLCDTCPFGFTIEINARCLTKYTEEELVAAIIHDVAQVALSDTARTRFIKAYTDVISNKSATVVAEMFEDISVSEALYIAFTEICLRPFKLPIIDGASEYVATDSILAVIKLDKEYNSYLQKALPMSNDTIEARVDQTIRDDYRDMNTVICACMDHSIHHYYARIREQIPLISLTMIFDKKTPMLATGFISRKRSFHNKINKDFERREKDRKASHPICESFNDPADDYEIRFAIDKIINGLRYAETEAERDVALFKIKQLSIKLERQKIKYQRKVTPGIEAKIKNIDSYLAELERIRVSAMEKEIKQKRWCVYVKDELPAGYDF